MLLRTELCFFMKKAVLAGGSGFLGQALARSLSADGYEVVVLGRSSLRVVQPAGSCFGMVGSWVIGSPSWRERRPFLICRVGRWIADIRRKTVI